MPSSKKVKPQHCILIPTKAELEEMLKEQERQLALLMEVNINSRPRHCITLLLLKCADIAMQLGS